MLIKPLDIYPLIKYECEDYKFVDSTIYKLPKILLNITSITIKIIKSSLQIFF